MPDSNFTAWMTDARTVAYFGRAFKLRADVLAAVINGDNLTEVALQNGVTRAAASKQARRAKIIFNGAIGNQKLPS